MFAALKISDRSRVNSIAAQWDGREENLRELARSGQLVCPGCEQLLWLRTGDVRRRHFAHRDLSECRLGKQTAEVLEAKAQLFTLLESKFPGQVQIDLELDMPGVENVPDLVVEMEDGRRFIYWVFDRQIRNRSGYPKPPENKTERTHYIHTESAWTLGPETGIVLSASQRHFISYSDFDLALNRPGNGHLHFFSTSDSTLRIYRGLRCIHGPGLHDWEELREGSLESALAECTVHLLEGFVSFGDTRNHREVAEGLRDAFRNNQGSWHQVAHGLETLTVTTLAGIEGAADPPAILIPPAS